MKYIHYSKIIKKILKYLIAGLLLFAFIRIFICDRYIVNTGSMQPTISPGETVYVNKLIFGARLYTQFKFDTEDQLHSFRIPGIRKLKRNDIIVFNFPLNDNWNKVTFKINHIYVKRCVGLPGDIIYIANGFYKIKGITDTIGYIPNQQLLSKLPPEYLPKNLQVFPAAAGMPQWTILEWGPYYIPRKGTSIPLDTCNYMFYKNYIAYETGKSIYSDANGQIYINGSITTSYQFKYNYYFVAGDYVFDSCDSRYFGVVPEEYIIGVANIHKYH